MRNEWILDVISDLKSFADSNGMIELAQQLAQTQQTAEAELSQATVPPIGRPQYDGGHAGTLYRADPPRGNA